MAKTITVSSKGFVDATPLRIRPQLVSFVYSMAAHHGWAIRVAGQHWGGDKPSPMTTLKGTPPGITDAQWAMLMGIKPNPAPTFA